MSSPQIPQTDERTEDEPEEESPYSSLYATIASAEEQDDNQGGGMSLLTSSYRFRPVTPSQVQDAAEDEIQYERATCPEDAIIETTELPSDAPVPVHAPMPPPDQEVGIPTETSDSGENNHIRRYTRPELFGMPREPPSSLPQFKYTPLRLTHPAMRPPSAMEHRTRTPTPEIASVRATTPTPEQTAVLFNQNERHGQSTYTSEPPQLVDLNPEDRDDDAKIWEFAWERPMAPHLHIDIDRLPRQGNTERTVRTIQSGK
jgi:hypothetical protein